MPVLAHLCRVSLLAAACLTCVGCAEIGYLRVAVGESPAKAVKKALPAESSVSPYGYSFFDDWLLSDGHTAVVVVLDEERVARAKFRVDAGQGRFWGKDFRELRVRGEFTGRADAADAQDAAMLIQDMIDTIRPRHPVREVSQASRLTAAALVRVLQAMSGTPGDAAVADLGEILAKLPDARRKVSMAYRGGRWQLGYYVRQ